MDNEIISLDSVEIEEEIITHERYNRPTPNGGDTPKFSIWTTTENMWTKRWQQRL